MEDTNFGYRLKLHLIREQQVILDSDLANFYQTETKKLNQAVKRNQDRFPEDFVFQLTTEETYTLLQDNLGLVSQTQAVPVNSLHNHPRSQSVTLDPLQSYSRSQSVTLKLKRGQNFKYRPYVFTEYGIAMLSGILNSPIASQVNIAIFKAFARLRRAEIENLKARSEATLADHQLKRRTPRRRMVHNSKTRESVYLIQSAVADYFEVNLSDLKTSKRSGKLPFARQMAMYLIREQLELQYREIGRYFGGKDHSTVIHACQQVINSISASPATQQIISELMTLIG